MNPIVVIAPLLFFANPEAPGWLKEAASSTLPAYEAKVPAAVWLKEETVTIQDAGSKTRTLRYAVKVLNREGVKSAERGISYFSGAGKVRDVRAWLIPPSGKVKEYGKNDVVDASVADGLYDDSRLALISARRDAEPGAIFGFEATLDEKTVFSQFEFPFQGDLPASRSSFSLNLPTGWRADGKLLDGSAITPQVSGNSYRWQVTNLAPFDDEPNSPERESLTPVLVVSTFPPEGAAGGATGHFEHWKDVSSWTSRLVDPSATITPEIEAHVKSLTGGAAGFWEKLRPLASDAQKIRYISIQLNLARGGGYVPHSAASVLRNAYGDCKDKANYLRTMLKVAGIESYPVSIYSADPRHTRRGWPSPEQFDHMILAIRTPDDTKLPSSFDFPGLGRLMLFDPTNDVVPLGYVPDYEQQSLALLIAGDKGDLFETPSSQPSANLLKRTAHLKLNANGDLVAGLVQDMGVGQAAFDMIARKKSLSTPEFTKRMQSRVNRNLTGANVTKVDSSADPTREKYQLDLEFTAAHFANTQGRLLIFKPAVLPYYGGPDVTSSKRRLPLVVEPVAYEEHVEVEIPEGFAVDEVPDSGSVKSDYGSFTVSWKVNGNVLVFERKVELVSALVPVADYKKARDFFAALGETEQAPVVLMRKN